MELFKDDLLQAIGKELIRRSETLAVAESVTSGAIQLAISTIIDASRFYQGGITAYNVAQKFRHLNVEPIDAIASNCVSQSVAEQMATHVTSLFTSHWGVAITGYAVPVPQSEDDVYAWYAIAYKGEIKVSGKLDPDKDDTMNLQLFFANEVCRQLYKQLTD